MNNVIEKNENLLGYVKDLRKYFENEIEKCNKRIADLQSEELYTAKVCGSVDNFYYESLVEGVAGDKEIIQDILEDLKTAKDYELVCVMYNPMGNLFYKRVSVVDSETKEQIM